MAFIQGNFFFPLFYATCLFRIFSGFVAALMMCYILPEYLWEIFYQIWELSYEQVHTSHSM